MIAARVQNDMSTVKTLLDGAHSKLAELELQTIKHSRELIKRLNNQASAQKCTIMKSKSMKFKT